MPAAPIDKVIVTNKAVLKRKYGSQVSRINTALQELVDADAQRGLNTIVVDLGSAAAMKKYKGTAVKATQASDAAANKRAIDKVFKATRPAYLMLLGATDVIPHQPLKNPLYAINPSTGESDDPDKLVDSDLPYACDAAYSTDVRKFLNPTRVVGRLPDVTGAGDVAYLEGVLKTAAGYQQRPVKEYDACFALSTATWMGSTKKSLKSIFQSTAGLNVVPPKGPPWPDAALKSRAQFINCHGNTATPSFTGEKVGPEPDFDKKYPTALSSSDLPGHVANGTVVAAECCYGAELYDPQLAMGEIGICNAYLGEQAYGFFGSSTIAYGPTDGTDYADILCLEFLKEVRKGASVGRACLTARLKYLDKPGPFTPTDLKTFAQFALLADPSVTPVQTAVSPHAVAALPKWKPAALAVGGAQAGQSAVLAMERLARNSRRQSLLNWSNTAAALTAISAETVVEAWQAPKAKVTAAAAKSPKSPLDLLRQWAAQMNLTHPVLLSAKVPTAKAQAAAAPKSPAAKLALASAAAGPAESTLRPTTVHVVMERQLAEAADQKVGLIVRGFEAIEYDGLVEVRQFQSR